MIFKSPSSAEALQLTVVPLGQHCAKPCRLCFCAIYTTEFATRPCVNSDLPRTTQRLQSAFCLLAQVLKLCLLGFGVYFCGQARNKSDLVR